MQLPAAHFSVLLLKWNYPTVTTHWTVAECLNVNDKAGVVWRNGTASSHEFIRTNSAQSGRFEMHSLCVLEHSSLFCNFLQHISKTVERWKVKMFLILQLYHDWWLMNYNLRQLTQYFSPSPTVTHCQRAGCCLITGVLFEIKCIIQRDPQQSVDTVYVLQYSWLILLMHILQLVCVFCIQ